MNPPRFVWVVLCACVLALTASQVLERRYEYSSVGDSPIKIDRWKQEWCLSVGKSALCQSLRGRSP